MTQPPALAVVVKGWPRLSETFIAQELVALEEAGLPLGLWSLRHPTDRKTHPLHDRLRAGVTYLPEYLHDEKARVIRSCRRAWGLPGYAAARALWRADLRRDRTRNRVRRFGQACVMAAELPAETRAIYAHYLHTPSSVARYAAVMRGPALGLLRPCQGHLDLARLGVAQQAFRGVVRCRVRHHLHRLRRGPPARPGGGSG